MIVVLFKNQIKNKTIQNMIYFFLHYATVEQYMILHIGGDYFDVNKV